MDETRSGHDVTCDLELFIARYRGSRAPEDALHWLHHPDQPGPTGASPPQDVFLALADDLVAAGRDDLARAALDACAELLAHERRMTLDALEGHCDGPGPGAAR